MLLAGLMALNVHIVEDQSENESVLNCNSAMAAESLSGACDYENGFDTWNNGWMYPDGYDCCKKERDQVDGSCGDDPEED